MFSISLSSFKKVILLIIFTKERSRADRQQIAVLSLDSNRSFRIHFTDSAC